MSMTIQLTFTCSTASFKNHQHPNQTHYVRTVGNSTKKLDELWDSNKRWSQNYKIRTPHRTYNREYQSLPTAYTY